MGMTIPGIAYAEEGPTLNCENSGGSGGAGGDGGMHSARWRWRKY